MRKIAGYLTKNRSGKDQKNAQSTHENECIKPRKLFGEIQNSFLVKGRIHVSFRKTGTKRVLTFAFLRQSHCNPVAKNKTYFCIIKTPNL